MVRNILVVSVDYMPVAGSFRRLRGRRIYLWRRFMHVEVFDRWYRFRISSRLYFISWSGGKHRNDYERLVKRKKFSRVVDRRI